jgi:tripartite ATP-independent transporter DctM subunit
LLGVLYTTFIIVYAWLKPSVAPLPKNVEPVSILIVIKVFKSIIPPAMLILAVLGSIFMGIATPTEASGVGALGAFLLAVSRGRLSFKDFKSVINKTTHTTSYIFALFVGATAFALILRGLGGDELIEGALTSLPFGPEGVVIVVLIIAFILGFFLDWIEITLIILPFLAPVMVKLDVDLVWFIVLFAVVLQTSFITPPVGFALFYVKGVAPQGVTIKNIYRGIIPFVILQIIAVAIVFSTPEIVTWLPNVAYGP